MLFVCFGCFRVFGIIESAIMLFNCNPDYPISFIQNDNLYIFHSRLNYHRKHISKRSDDLSSTQKRHNLFRMSLFPYVHFISGHATPDQHLNKNKKSRRTSAAFSITSTYIKRVEGPKEGPFPLVTSVGPE